MDNQLLESDHDLIQVMKNRVLKSVRLENLTFEDRETKREVTIGINERNDEQFVTFPIPDQSRLTVDVYYCEKPKQQQELNSINGI